jgi:hypothetical protein
MLVTWWILHSNSLRCCDTWEKPLSTISICPLKLYFLCTWVLLIAADRTCKACLEEYGVSGWRRDWGSSEDLLWPYPGQSLRVRLAFGAFYLSNMPTDMSQDFLNVNIHTATSPRCHRIKLSFKSASSDWTRCMWIIPLSRGVDAVYPLFHRWTMALNAFILTERRRNIGIQPSFCSSNKIHHLATYQ